MSKTHVKPLAFKQPVERLAYSIAEVAAKLGVSARHVRRLIDKGEFPRPVPLGGRTLILAADLDRYIAGLVNARDGGKA